MRVRSLAFALVVLSCIFALPAGAQQTSTAIGQVMNALVGQNLVRSASLMGTVTSPNVPGSASAAISLYALSQQWSEVDIEWPTGKQTEIRSGAGIFPSRSWTGSDGIAHRAAPTDLKLPHPAWFFPTFVLLSGLGSPNYWASDLGAQTWQGQNVHHIAVWQRAPSGILVSYTHLDVYKRQPPLLHFTRRGRSHRSIRGHAGKDGTRPGSAHVPAFHR